MYKIFFKLIIKDWLIDSYSETFLESSRNIWKMQILLMLSLGVRSAQIFIFPNILRSTKHMYTGFPTGGGVGVGIINTSLWETTFNIKTPASGGRAKAKATSTKVVQLGLLDPVGRVNIYIDSDEVLACVYLRLHTTTHTKLLSGTTAFAWFPNYVLKAKRFRRISQTKHGT